MNTPSSIAATTALILEEQRRIDAFVHRQIVPYPPATRVAMVGPHPDDNLFGPGSTTIKYADAGVPVQWICLTDGRACVGPREERQRMAELRGAEETACARSLGIDDPELFAIPEDRLLDPARRDATVARLRAYFDQHKPDGVFVPYFLENHPLHRYTTFLVALALTDYAPDCSVYSWAVASFPPPSVVVDTSEVFARKLEAAKLYQTQMTICDYTEQLSALSRYHAVFGPEGAQFCDVFLAQTREAFVEETLGLHLDHEETLSAGVQPVIPEQD